MATVFHFDGVAWEFSENSKTELVHRRHPWPEKAVNNSYSRNENRLIWRAELHCSQVLHRRDLVNKPVHINPLKEGRNLLDCSQFIERTERAAEVERLSRTFQDNPG